MPRAQKKTRKMSGCETEGCTDPVYCLGLCHACYSYDYFWTKQKNAAERRQHVKNLEKRARRMETIQHSGRLRRVK